MERCLRQKESNQPIYELFYKNSHVNETFYSFNELQYTFVFGFNCGSLQSVYLNDYITHFSELKKNTNNNEKKCKAAHTYAPHFTRKRLLLKTISRFYNNAESKRKQRAFSTNRDISRHLQPLLIQLSSVLLVLLQSK